MPIPSTYPVAKISRQPTKRIHVARPSTSGGPPAPVLAPLRSSSWSLCRHRARLRLSIVVRGPLFSVHPTLPEISGLCQRLHTQERERGSSDWNVFSSSVVCSGGSGAWPSSARRRSTSRFAMAYSPSCNTVICWRSSVHLGVAVSRAGERERTDGQDTLARESRFREIGLMNGGDQRGTSKDGLPTLSRSALIYRGGDELAP